MPSKKVAAKKRKGGTKTTAKKRSSKKPSVKKAGGAASRRKTSTKKASSKKRGSSKKKTVKKPSSKKPQRAKAAKKKASAKKTRVSKKAAAKKRPSSKKNTVKATKTATKEPSGKKISTKKVTSKKKPSRGGGKARRMDLLSSPGGVAGAYQPRRGEGYMSSAQLEHFRQLLTNWKRELMEEVDRTMLHMKDEAANFPDPNDRATQESEFGLELRTRDRERKLLRKIDSALQRIDDGSYGYCAETGEEIGLRRLEARPVATLCVEAQERRELAERQYRDRDDQYR